MAGGPAPGGVWALTVLTVLEFLNYLDRYVLAAVLPALHHDPAFAALSDARLGLLQSGFLIVHTVFSPTCGVLRDRLQRRFIIAVCVAVLSGAAMMSGLSHTYGELFLSRALIGFGEAGYAAVAPAIIN